MKTIRLLNADSLPSNHPFWNSTADCEIQFCLAHQKPDGTTTNGIMRYNIGQSSVTKTYMESNVKPQTIWDRSKYLNIWVVKFSTSQSILGYAQFPGGSGNTDGVVIAHTAFGYVGTATAPYNNGRTAVHEIGHWLNLYHIWGDNFCGDDLISDTKPAEDANYGCKTFPYNVNNACGAGANGEMFMNYMDYSDDNCLVMFTFGQKNRMKAALNGARASLFLNPNTCNYPVGVSSIDIAKNTIDLYPNPATDFLNISYKGDLLFNQYAVLDATGKIITKGEIKSLHSRETIQIPIQSLSKGFYILKLTEGENSISQKFFKQ
ncbi:MAG: M43 family zinc metalloprotease [Chitinophagaceae bacterium]